MSSLEKIIYKILIAEKIKFQQEKIFKDCYNGYYRFDFFLPEYNYIIEVNGAQHYQFTKQFHKHRSDFTKAQERDRRKISYCLANNITIYIIPYWEVPNIKTFKDMTNPLYRALDKFHNDYVWRHQKQ